MSDAQRDSSAGAAVDDLGLGVAVPPAVRRVVSLVPSLTESVAVSAPGLLVAATRWCVHPPSLAVERVGGTKNPDVARIAALAPDVVLANEEENRPADLDALRAAGIPVWVTRVRRLPDAFGSLDRMLRLACRLERPAWLNSAEAAWAAPPGGARAGTAGGAGTEAAAGVPARRAVVPVWRRPWMVLGRDTFAGDVLARLGIANIYAGHAERYPKVPLAELRAAGADLVVLPDEPYAFSADDGPEAFAEVPAALVSGRHLTWYGPSLAEAPAVLRAQLAPQALLPPGRGQREPGRSER